MAESPTQKTKERRLHPAKECAYLSMFVALLIAVQLALFAVPGVELITVLLASYAFCMGVRRGVIAAVAFSLLRQLVFGFYPNVLALYLLYYPAFAATFGLLGKKLTRPTHTVWVVAACATLASVAFTMIDNILTPLWYGYTERAAKLYFNASFAFLIPHAACAAISVSALFLPLWAVFKKLKGSLEG